MSGLVYHTASKAFANFRGWIDLALAAHSLPVMTASQKGADGFREDLPYVTVEWLRSRQLGLSHRRVGDEVAPGDPGGLTHQHFLGRLREGVVQVVFYGDEGHDLAEELEGAKARTPESEYLTNNGISVRPISEILDTRELRDTVHEASAAQDWAVIYATQEETRVGTIEAAEIMDLGKIPIEEPEE